MLKSPEKVQKFTIKVQKRDRKLAAATSLTHAIGAYLQALWINYVQKKNSFLVNFWCSFGAVLFFDITIDTMQSHIMPQCIVGCNGNKPGKHFYFDERSAAPGNCRQLVF